jgi:hypothetical protein
MAFYTFMVSLGSPKLLTYEGCMVEAVVEKQNADLSYSTYVVNSEVIRLGGFYTHAIVSEEGSYRIQLLECACPPAGSEELAIIEKPASGIDGVGCCCSTYEQLVNITGGPGDEFCVEVIATSCDGQTTYIRADGSGEVLDEAVLTVLPVTNLDDCCAGENVDNLLLDGGDLFLLDGGDVLLL